MSKESTGWELIERVDEKDGDTAILECRMLVTDTMLLSFAYFFITLREQDSQVDLFLASQDALEVMLVSESVSESLTLRTELTDVTLVSEDTY